MNIDETSIDNYKRAAIIHEESDTFHIGSN
jgi:hypothetical protein